MANKFNESIKTAKENKWCTTPNCTTCSAREYRQYLIDLKDSDSVLSVGPVDSLSNLNPSELTKIDNWRDPLLVAIIDLHWQREQILKSWLNEARRGRKERKESVERLRNIKAKYPEQCDNIPAIKAFGGYYARLQTIRNYQ